MRNLQTERKGDPRQHLQPQIRLGSSEGLQLVSVQLFSRCPTSLSSQTSVRHLRKSKKAPPPGDPAGQLLLLYHIPKRNLRLWS